MNQIKRKKQAMTLLEVMVVILIIGIISSVVGYNMRGSIEQGKAFKTRETISKVYNIIQLEMTPNDLVKFSTDKTSTSSIKNHIEKILESSELLSQPKQYLVDGWKEDLIFSVDTSNNFPELRITSRNYENFCTKQNKPFDYPWGK